MAMLDYPYMRAYNTVRGGSLTRLLELVQRARREHAPATAVAHTGGLTSRGAWLTVDSLTEGLRATTMRLGQRYALAAA